ncbi:TetR family transcriptional regulator [Sphingomonas adhaesiva]|uniref:TetR family transcriptional regulator n=1 Tax=Sphingomonas adhaesiva TaxID=28212 RepID=UPI002FF6A90D
MSTAAPAAVPATADERPARDMLLEAASVLMIAQGTSDVSLHAIARHAGVTAPLVKYYFGSKEGLLVALVERDTARSLAQLQDLLAMDIDPVAKLRLHITGIVRNYARHPYLNALLGQLVRGSGNAASERIRASFVTPLIEAQRRIVEEGVAAGQFRAVDPDHLYFLIVGACQYLFAVRVPFGAMMGGRHLDEPFARTFAKTVVDVVLNGLRA